MFDSHDPFIPRPRHWLLAALALALFLAAGVYRMHRNAEGHALQMAERQLNSVARLRGIEIRRWLDDRLIFLAQPADNLVARAVLRLKRNPDDAAALGELSLRISQLRQSDPEIRAIRIYDVNGNPIAGSLSTDRNGTPFPSLDQTHADAIRQVHATGKPVMVDFHRHDPDGAGARPFLDVLAPLHDAPDASGRILGLLLFKIDPAHSFYPMLDTWPVPSATAETLLVRTEGDDLVALSPLRHSSLPPLELRLPADTPELIAGQAVRSAPEDIPPLLTGVDYRKRPVVAAALHIQDTPWLLEAKMDEAEVFAEAERRLPWLLAGAAAIFLALLAAGRAIVAILRARARETGYRLLAESGSDMLWLYDLHRQRFAYVSPSAEAMRGYTPDEILQHDLDRTLTPESQEHARVLIADWLKSFDPRNPATRTRHFEASQPCRDGRTILTESVMTLVADEEGRPTHVQGITRDITERRRIEAALAESENRFRSVYDTINDGIFVHDAATGRIIDINAGACRMYGHTREQMLELGIADLSANEPPCPIERAWEHVQVARERGWDAFEWLALDSRGRRFWVAVNLKTFAVGGQPYLLAVVRDIDDRRQAEEALKAALEEARALNHQLAEAHTQLLQSEKMASIGQLAAGVAHELNNPIGFVHSNLGSLESYLRDLLAIIDAYAALEADVSGPSPALDAVRALKRDRDLEYLRTDIAALVAESKDGLGRVTRIVRDLKDFARAGDTSLQLADLHPGIDSTLNIVWNELKYKCTVKKEYGDLPPIRCMPSQLNQVFMNLLINAAHAIGERGEITIRTGRRDDEVFVAISDTGCGIAPEHLNRIFEPFFTTKAVGKGTGLGLSLAYGIVQKHKGRIEVESTVGKGSTFTVWLPIEGMPATDGAPAAA